MPSCLVHKDGNLEAYEDVEVEYLFERFEQVQTIQFRPLRGRETTASMDAEMRQILDGMPDGLMLNYRTREGGIVGGSTSELSLVYDTTHEPLTSKTDAERATRDETRREMNLRLAGTSLGLVNALTRINAGELQPFHSSDSER